MLGTLGFQQDALQDVAGDVPWRVEARLQQVGQELQGAFWVVLLHGDVNQAQAPPTQLLSGTEAAVLLLNAILEEQGVNGSVKRRPNKPSITVNFVDSKEHSSHQGKVLKRATSRSGR